MMKLGTLKRVYMRLRLMPMNGHKKAAWYKRHRLLHKQGEHCFFQISDFGTEPYLIEIGNNVWIAAGARFVTHDVSVLMISRYLGAPNSLDKLGRIIVHDNCFIGLNAIIMPNVTIGPNALVGAGAVVTKDVPPNSIVVGNPAKVVGQFDDYVAKLQSQNETLPWKHLLGPEKHMHAHEIHRLRLRHFWGDQP